MIKNNSSFTCVNMYRSPKGSTDVFFSKFSELIDELYAPEKQLVRVTKYTEMGRKIIKTT